MALVVKNLPASVGDVRDMSLIPGLGRSPGEGHGNPLQYSCLENPMDKGPWQVKFHGAAQSRTRLKWFSTHRKQLSMLACIWATVHRGSRSQTWLNDWTHTQTDTWEWNHDYLYFTKLCVISFPMFYSFHIVFAFLLFYNKLLQI